MREPCDGIGNLSPGDIHITEFAGSDWIIVTLDTQAAGLEPAWNVRKRSSIHQLPHNGGC